MAAPPANRLLLGALTLALAMALPSAATAEEEQDPAEYETVVHGRDVEEERPADDPAGFTTVLRIKAPPAGTDLPRLVERVPGLRVRATGPGGRKTLSLRGADSQQAVVILDGVRLSSATGGGGVDLSLIDPAHLERIEVRRGGGSARFGSAAVGGALVLSTPRLRTRDRSRASVSYGSQNEVAARASHSGSALGKLRYLASASYRQGDGDFPYTHHINGTDHVRQNNDHRQGQLLLKGEYVASDRWRVGFLDNLAVGARGAAGILDQPCSTSRQDDLRNLAALKATRYDLLLPDSKLNLILSHRLGRFRFREPCAFNRPSDSEAHDIGLTSSLALPLGDTGRMDAGLELREERLIDRLPAGQQTIRGGSVRRFNADLWASSSIRLLDDHLVLVPAVRLAVSEGIGAAIAPRAGLVIRPLRWTKNRWLAPVALAANFGRSYRNPSFHEMYIDMVGVRSNPNLRPEDALDGDVGLRYELGLLAVEAAYFRRYIKDLILYAPVSPYLVEANNYPGVDADGVEASLRFTPGWGVDLRGAYTHTRTSWDDPEVSLPGHPAHRLAARLAWAYPWGGKKKPAWELELWSGVTYESGMPLDRANNITVGSRVLLSAGGSFRYRWISLAAEGRNLLDRRDLLDSLGFPLPPARFMISLSGAL